MTQINLKNPRIEQFLADYAHKLGVDLGGAVEQLAIEHIQRAETAVDLVAEPVDPETDPVDPETDPVDPETDPVILLMNRLIAQIPTDPEELRKNEEEAQDFLNQLNQNRIDSGEEPLF